MARVHSGETTFVPPRAANAADVAAAALIVLGGCSARHSGPIAGAFDDGPAAIARGKQVFMASCHSCHPGREAGLAPAINNKPLPGFMIKTQVRLGVGAMPRFSRDELSAGQLDDLVTYLEALRRHG